VDDRAVTAGGLAEATAMFAARKRAEFPVDEGDDLAREIARVVADRRESTYWLPPSAVKQSGNTMIAGPIFRSWIRRAARSGTLSPNGFHAVCESPEPVKPTRS